LSSPLRHLNNRDTPEWVILGVIPGGIGYFRVVGVWLATGLLRKSPNGASNITESLALLINLDDLFLI
jgi:hypothetical protein